MKEMGKSLLLVVMWLAFAGNVGLALFLAGRALSGLVARLRERVGRTASVNGSGEQARVVRETWTKKIDGAGREARERGALL